MATNGQRMGFHLYGEIDLVPPLSEMIVPEIEAVVGTFSLTKVYESYDRKAFGDGELILCGPGVSIRFIRERHKIFMDIGGDTGDWEDAIDVLEKLHVYASVESPEPVPISELVALVCSNAEAIKRVVAEE